MRPSISEDNGLALMTKQDKRIYSVGISTGAAAEMRMALASPSRHIIASTLDPEGIRFAKAQVEAAGMQDQIEVKLEDVAKSIPYSDGAFDFIYARLVLHYLSKSSLIQALDELFRVLKPGGKLFVVVRSVDCVEAKGPDATLDPKTGMTTYHSNGLTFTRYFHTEKSIQEHLLSVGFQIQHVKSYREQLCIDFQRKQLSEHVDALIEVLATKRS